MEGSPWEVSKFDLSKFQMMEEMHEPLLHSPRGSRGGAALPMWPLYGMSFVRALALAVASLPACSLRVQELVLAAGGDGASTALAIGLVCALRHVAEFVAGHFLSSWSDKVGRQPALLVSCAAFVVESAFMALCSSPWLLGAAHVFGGFLFTGGTVESLSIQDQIRDDDESASAHGRLFASVGIALMFGPALGGSLALRYGGAAPFAFAHVLGLVAVAGVGSCLPEYISLRTLRRRRSRRVSWDVPENGQADHSILRVLRQVPRLRWSCFALALNGFGMAIFAAIDVLWMQAAFGWDGHQLGVFMGFSTFLQLASQALILPCLLKALSGRETVIAKICLVTNALKFIGFASAEDHRWMLITSIAAAPGYCGTPILMNLCTKQVAQALHGPWTLAVSVINTVASALGALVGSRMLAEGLRGSRSLGMPLLFAAACYFLAGACVTQAEHCRSARPVARKGP